jgi:CubicO group peptidase (beta-lactamase class C family)
VGVAVCLVVGCGNSGSTAGGGLAVRVQRSVDEFLSSRLVPGASVAVIDDGELVTVVSGSADLAGDRAVATDTQFRVASVTKLYLAALTLKLVQRGEVSLDEPIGVRPLELPPQLEFARELTLRQLLSHTSGLDQTFTREEDRHRALTIADILERIPPAVCQPSACWSYADGNYALVQVVLEAATAHPLMELVRDELLEPLGLRHTVVVDAANVDTVLPSQYALVSDDAGRPLEPHRLFEQSLPRSSTLITTAADAATFADALFSGDLLGAESLEMMLDTSAMRDLPCPHDCRFEYGLGVFHYNIAGHDLVGHDGSSGAIVVHDRGQGVTIAILSNGGEQDIGKFLETVLDTIDAETRTNGS